MQDFCHVNACFFTTQVNILFKVMQEKFAGVHSLPLPVINMMHGVCIILGYKATAANARKLILSKELLQRLQNYKFARLKTLQHQMLDKVVHSSDFNENQIGGISAGCLFLMKWIKNVHQLDVDLIFDEATSTADPGNLKQKFIYCNLLCSKFDNQDSPDIKMTKRKSSGLAGLNLANLSKPPIAKRRMISPDNSFLTVPLKDGNKTTHSVGRIEEQENNQNTVSISIKLPNGDMPKSQS